MAAAQADMFPVVTTPYPNNTMLVTEIGDLAARATFLALFIIIGVVGNCVLVASIVQSSRLKGVVLNLFLISICVVNLLDCLVNMPLILGSAIREHWDYGSFLCHFNAFLMQLVTISMVLGLFLMTLDRFLAIRHPKRYSQILTKTKANVLIVYTWIHSTAFSLPLALKTSISVVAFPARYSCSIKAGAPLLYVALTSLLGILAPLLIMMGFFIYIIKVGCEDKIRRQRAQRNYAEHVNEEAPRLGIELSAAKYVGILVILWAVFQGPYLLLTYIEQYRTTSELEAAMFSNFSYPWEMELAFTWMKLSYPMFIPLVTFCWMKEVWQKFKNFILCRKSNLIVDASPNSSPNHRNNNTKPPKPTLENSVPTVPVIFATEEGLHFQTYVSQREEEPKDLQYTIINGSQVITARKCDIYGSQDFMQLREDEDTSDYDSHGDMDPLSTSNGLSVKSAEIQNQAYEAYDTRGDDPYIKSDHEMDNVAKVVQENKIPSRKQKRPKAVKGSDTDILRLDSDSGRGSLQSRFHVEDEKSTESNSIPRDVNPPTSATQGVPQDFDGGNCDEMGYQKPKRKKKKKKLDKEEEDGGKEDVEGGNEVQERPVPAPRTKLQHSHVAAQHHEDEVLQNEGQDQQGSDRVTRSMGSKVKLDSVPSDSDLSYKLGPEIDADRKCLGKERSQRRGITCQGDTLVPSLDYKNMHILASKAVSETVHIGPKTPDASIDLDCVKYPSRGRRKIQRDEESNLQCGN